MIIDFPATLTLVTRVEWGQQRRDLVFDSPFASQSAEIAAPLWKVMLTPARFNRAECAEWEMLLLSMAGRQNQLALWHLDRPAPRGTLRGTMTLTGAHAAGATQITLVAAGQAAKTLLKGDHLGLGSGTTRQVVKVAADATSDGSGNITVTVHPALRNAFAAAAAVTWDKPKALFRRLDSASSMSHQRGGVDGTALDLIEDWRSESWLI